MEMTRVNAKSNNSNAKTNGVKEKAKKIVRIQVSKTKKPFFFYLNLAKKYIKQGNDVELSALGMAIPTVVIISEILKSNGWAFEKNITTSTVAAKEDKEGREIPKAKLGVLLGKAGDMDQSTVDASLGKNADD
ncbi:hypothetical protein AAZX31_01G220300 [Glycine max]|uniref:DNA/RNA-binding protein Alba-like domain-containing protein n=2 Tax=Glycine subgen. Soja TaxID=1462606 RepID=I1JAQ0_SOYBN|nr:uncharacterized protein At2g34160 [Glycine max]XP_028180456.1 uncharacterized protein At2g34160-like [Glycine soja]KAG5061639.1 hypothetical protein JHK87_002668 [Glycine soja]KAG5090059.1 hypothetical protein JHK86_002671 [Glycine max]KAH1164400.1 hypothetical protein GYH30_002431 [Glycine max]KAH1267758.1 Uncharacterized protein GmHk_01G002899 [Glycine max]KHN34125.1 Hypothetical protein glysoja_038614 [Glycine soja]|eukprot:XP_003517563.1 uncharacterized protein At2g34160 [Glycine max]